MGREPHTLGISAGKKGSGPPDLLIEPRYNPSGAGNAGPRDD
jgi:hypothetical protein